PRVKFLATSREALGTSGEQALQVPPLSVPGIDPIPPLPNLPEFEAVRLFRDRVRLGQPAFDIQEQNRAAVAEVCHRLDGIPLAIELAAARVRHVPVEQIALRLDRRFRLLTGGSRTALPRHQTLRASIDWS